MAKSWLPKAHTTEPPIDKGGFWITHPQLSPDKDGKPAHKANAYLENPQHERVFMWVDDVTADFAMTGNVAQSRKQREFFPHNFTQPSIHVHCQTPNSYQYNRLGAFIREGQKQGMVQQGDVLRLRIASGGEEAARHVMKGHHNHISVDGYVTTAPRGAERFINAPDYEFDFVITHAWNFLGLQDQAVTVAHLRTIMGIVGDPALHWHWENGKPPKNNDNQGSSPHTNEGIITPGLSDFGLQNDPTVDPFK